MSVALRQTLQEFCFGRRWNYAVFWRTKTRNKTILMWEDGCTDFGLSDTDKCATVDVNYPALMMAISKMSYHVYAFGEGLFGRVAVSREHKWVFSPIMYKSENHVSFKQPINHKFPAGWQQQFELGIKTIALIPVAGGVVQLGSTSVIPEDEKTVLFARSAFAGLQNIPGAFLSDFVTGIPQELPSIVPDSGIAVSLLSNPDSNLLPPRVSLRDISKLPSAKQLLATTAARHVSRQIQSEHSRKKQYTFPPPPTPHATVTHNFSTAELAQSRANLMQSSLTSRPTLPCALGPERSLQIRQIPLKAFENARPNKWTGWGGDQLSQPNGSFQEPHQGDLPSCNPSRDPWLRKHGLVGNGFDDKQSFGGSSYSRGDCLPWISSSPGPLPDFPETETGLLGDVVAHSVKRSVGREAQQPWEAYMPQSNVSLGQETGRGRMQTMEAFEPPAGSSGGDMDLAELEEQATQEVLRKVGYYSVSGQASARDRDVQSQWEKKFGVNVGGDLLLEGSCKRRVDTEETIGSSNGRNEREERHTGEKSLPVEDEPMGISVSAMKQVADEGAEKGKKGKKKEVAGAKPRPRDRQLIQDRLKELRGIIPDTQKCSIDNLLERTMKHIQFSEAALLQRQRFDKMEETCGLKTVKDDIRGTPSLGRTPFQIKNLPSVPNHFAVQICCESEASPLQVVESLCKLGLLIRKSKLCVKNGTLSGHCIVQYTRPVQKAEVMWELMSVLRPLGSALGEELVDFGVGHLPQSSTRLRVPPSFSSRAGTLLV